LFCFLQGKENAREREEEALKKLSNVSGVLKLVPISSSSSNRILVVTPLCKHYPKFPRIKHLEKILSTLQEVHKKGIKHCDPAVRNWLVGNDNEILLNDFGSCIVGESTEDNWFGANDIEIPRLDLTRRNMTDLDDFLIVLRSCCIEYWLSDDFNDLNELTRENFEKMDKGFWSMLCEAGKENGYKGIMQAINKRIF
jgi:serine/threonine protein kinase